jgi:hypothetical protein
MIFLETAKPSGIQIGHVRGSVWNSLVRVEVSSSTKRPCPAHKRDTGRQKSRNSDGEEDNPSEGPQYGREEDIFLYLAHLTEKRIMMIVFSEGKHITSIP